MHKVDNLTAFICRLSWKSGRLNLLEPSEPVQACTRIALPLPLTFTFTYCFCFTIKLSRIVAICFNESRIKCRAFSRHTRTFLFTNVTISEASAIPAICLMTSQYSNTWHVVFYVYVTETEGKKLWLTHRGLSGP